MKKNNIIQKAILNLLYNEKKAIDSIFPILNNDFYNAVDMLSRAKGKIVVSGMGKSGHIGVKVASTFTSLGIPSVFLHPSEAAHGDLGLVSGGDALIAISNSGETKELLRIMRHLSRYKIITVSITGNKISPIARESDAALVFKVKEEGSPFNIAPMASTTASLVIGDMLATALSVKRGFTKEGFASHHPSGALGLNLTKVEEIMFKGDSVPFVYKYVPFNDALKEMTRGGLGITGVTSRGGRLVGVISDGDLRRFLLSSKFSTSSRAVDAMASAPKTISQTDSLQDALSKMEQHKITSLFVVDRFKKPVGIIHMHDIVDNKIV